MFQNVWMIGCLGVAGAAMAASSVLALVGQKAAMWAGALDRPTGGRKIHRRPIPLWGGLSIAMTIFAFVFFLTDASAMSAYIGGVFILLIGGMLDDRYDLPAWTQLFFPAVAACLVWGLGTRITQVTNPFGAGGISLRAWETNILTIGWLFIATYTTKVLDGLDGLVTGITTIGCGMIGALTLSSAYFQPAVALLASMVGGAFAGFLPHNAYPAKQFLGEAGSTIAGFSLGFLAILASSKVAIALAVLAIPLADICLVVIGRVRRGASFWKGDDTHLHFRLLQAGLSHPQVVRLLWALSFAAGALALSLQTQGKIFLMAMLGALTGGVSWYVKRKTAINENLTNS